MNNIYQKELGLQQYTKVFEDMLEFTS
ncbi:lipoyl(octanoyl) transferase LipB, partial [Francisella tularensis]|nr:lipoyl(octanoyl) transferase LipB [Francisella tularensis]